MNILEIVIWVVLLLSVLAGYKNGFLKTAFSLVSWILVLILCNVATPMVTQLLIEKTDLEITIQSVLDAKIDEMVAKVMAEAGVSELPEGVNLEFPEELQAVLPEEVKNVLATGGTITEEIMQGGLVDTAAIAERVVGILALLIVLVFSRVAILVVNLVLGIASKLPLVGPLDKVLGLACGAGKGLIWSWIVLTIVSVLALTGINTEWAAYISQSEFLVWLQSNNMILNLISNV